jgi:hypothetical protein
MPDDGYKYLLEAFDGKIEKRFENLLLQMQELLKGMGIIDKVNINTDLLELAVFDYFEDIYRLKEFQGIDRVNVDKIYSYGAYWILRRNPIQLIDTSLEPEYIHINEKICVAITIPKMLEEMGITATGDSERIKGFLELLYYNFRFRTFTQQSLELMIEAFFCGCCCFAPDQENCDE